MVVNREVSLAILPVKGILDYGVILLIIGNSEGKDQVYDSQIGSLYKGNSS